DGESGWGASCTAPYGGGTPVTLTASASGGSAFGGWSGCDGVSGLTCTVTMNASRSVTATFNVPRFTLTVSKGGTGTGTVTSADGGISCGPTCAAASAPYDGGTLVTLTASASGGATFGGWGGGGGVSGLACTRAMRAVRAGPAALHVPRVPLTGGQR